MEKYGALAGNFYETRKFEKMAFKRGIFSTTKAKTYGVYKRILRKKEEWLRKFKKGECFSGKFFETQKLEKMAFKRGFF